MKYLYVEGKDVNENSGEPTQDDLAAVDDNDLRIIRFENGQFEECNVSSDEVPDDEDDEGSSTHTEYTISSWSRV